MSFLSVNNLEVHYPVRGGFWNRIVDNVKAVDGVSFSISPGETVGLVGESGSGKSTTGKAIIGLEDVTSGSVTYRGKQIISKRGILKNDDFRKDIQMIFQDSLSSLNPKKRIEDIIAEPIRNFDPMSPKKEKLRVLELLNTVGLPPEALYKYPFQFSGGQLQRIGIARALATNPKLIIADEPVASLDLSVQAQVLNFMKKIQKESGTSYLFISHDLGVVRHMADKIVIMHKGRVVETGTRDDIYNRPVHIYTKRLLAAIPNTNVDTRKEHQEKRQQIDKDYERDEKAYYQRDGMAYPLTQLSETHWAALSPQVISKIQKSGVNK